MPSSMLLTRVRYFSSDRSRSAYRLAFSSAYTISLDSRLMIFIRSLVKAPVSSWFSR
ncbi:hypothetical protein D3C76_1699840 [compost metagenome]